MPLANSAIGDIQRGLSSATPDGDVHNIITLTSRCCDGIVRVMRTTLTLDDDVAALLKRALSRSRRPLKEVVNAALRDGLRLMVQPKRRSGSYRTSGVDLGQCLVGNVDDVAEVLAVAEGEAFK